MAQCLDLCVLQTCASEYHDNIKSEVSSVPFSKPKFSARSDLSLVWTMPINGSSGLDFCGTILGGLCSSELCHNSSEP